MSNLYEASFFTFLSGVGVFLAFVLGIAVVAANVFFALGVWLDSQALIAGGGHTHFAPAWAWTVLAFAGGVVTVAIYWFLHRSGLARASATPPAPAPVPPAPAGA